MVKDLLSVQPLLIFIPKTARISFILGKKHFSKEYIHESLITAAPAALFFLTALSSRCIETSFSVVS